MATRIVLAAGNKYEATEVRKHRYDDKVWIVVGRRWIKSKGHFSSNALLHCVGEAEPIEL